MSEGSICSSFHNAAQALDELADAVRDYPVAQISAKTEVFRDHAAGARFLRDCWTSSEHPLRYLKHLFTDIRGERGIMGMLLYDLYVTAYHLTAYSPSDRHLRSIENVMNP